MLDLFRKYSKVIVIIMLIAFLFVSLGPIVSVFVNRF